MKKKTIWRSNFEDRMVEYVPPCTPTGRFALFARQPDGSQPIYEIVDGVATVVGQYESEDERERRIARELAGRQIRLCLT